MSRFGRFLLIGGVGFIVDAAMLAVLLAVTPLGPLPARIVSIAVALVVTWQLNRSLTFGPSSRPVAVEGARYGGIGAATSVINYLAYAAALWVVPGLPPLAALAIGSAVALAFSFIGYSRLVFER